MSRHIQHWSCPECKAMTNYRGLCRDCTDRENDIYVHRERVNADGSPYLKAESSADLPRGIDSDAMRAHFVNARRRQKKTHKERAALQKAMKVGNEEVEAVAENNEIDEDTGEIVLGVSAEDEVIEEINSEG